jgi:hypothetical protein
MATDITALSQADKASLTVECLIDALIDANAVTAEQIQAAVDAVTSPEGKLRRAATRLDGATRVYTPGHA